MQLLTAAGFDVVRTNSVDRALAVVRSIVLEGVVTLVSEPPGAETALRSGINFISQMPRDSALATVLFVSGSLTSTEQRRITDTDTLIIDAAALTQRTVGTQLLQQIAGNRQS